MLPRSSKISFRSSLKTLAAVATVYSIFSVFPPSRPSPSYAFGSAPSSTRSPGEKPWSLDTPLVMAHRGGPGPGFPENCIETFNHSSQAGALLVEFDVRTTKDGHFVIIHDDSIARTTNGKGRVSDLPLSFLKTVHLKDPSGEVTAFKIPTLAEGLSWARNTGVVALDLKGPIDPASLVTEIHRSGAIPYSIIIAPSLQVAEQYYALSPQVLLSVPIENEKDLARILASSLNRSQIIAYVGQKEPLHSLYSTLRSLGMPALLNTVGTLDQRAQEDGADFYRNLVHRGAAIISTDFPVRVR